MAHRIRNPQIQSIEKSCKYFRSLFPLAKWNEIEENCGGKSIENDYEILLSKLKQAGFSTVLYRVLDSEIPSVFVVKSIVLGTKLRERIF
jgi:hypothetical protein